MRPIDADALKADWQENPPSYDMGRVFASLDLAPTIGGWISVKDRLPENEKIVICYTPCDGYMFIGFHRISEFKDYKWDSWHILTAMRSTKTITKKVTHWMPLPEPPEV